MTDDVTQDLLRDFAVVTEHPVVWGEMDAFGHVNNTVYFRYFENARIAYLERIGFTEAMERTGIGPILASTSCRFRRPLAYPDRVRVGGRAIDVAEDRFTMEYRVVSESLGALAAEGEGLVVSYDYNAGRKAPIPEDVREAIRVLEQD